MSDKLRKNLRRLSRSVGGLKNLNDLIASRSRRSGIPRQQVERNLLGAPEFTSNIDMSGYDGNGYLDDFLSSILLDNVPFDPEQFDHLSKSEVSHVVLYDLDSIPEKRRNHLANCESCRLTVNSIRPSATASFEVDES